MSSIPCLEEQETDDGWAFCVLPHGHDGPHQFVSDDEIMVFPVEQIRPRLPRGGGKGE